MWWVTSAALRTALIYAALRTALIYDVQKGVFRFAVLPGLKGLTLPPRHAGGKAPGNSGRDGFVSPKSASLSLATVAPSFIGLDH
jgi:hypothetical protein